MTHVATPMGFDAGLDLLHEQAARFQRLTRVNLALAPGARVDGALAARAHRVTPGWLAHRPRHRAETGIDGDSAPARAATFVHGVLLLDTGVDPQAERHADAVVPASVSAAPQALRERVLSVGDACGLVIEDTRIRRKLPECGKMASPSLRPYTLAAFITRAGRRLDDPDDGAGMAAAACAPGFDPTFGTDLRHGQGLRRQIEVAA